MLTWLDHAKLTVTLQLGVCNCPCVWTADFVWMASQHMCSIFWIFLGNNPIPLLLLTTRLSFFWVHCNSQIRNKLLWRWMPLLLTIIYGWPHCEVSMVNPRSITPGWLGGFPPKTTPMINIKSGFDTKISARTGSSHLLKSPPAKQLHQFSYNSSILPYTFSYTNYLYYEPITFYSSYFFIIHMIKKIWGNMMGGAII